MVSTPDRFISKSPISPKPSVTVINHNARKSLHIFTEVLNVKNKTAVDRVGAAKSKQKSIRAGNVLCSSITKRKRHTKINERVKSFFIIGFYNILRLCGLQLLIIALEFLLMVTLNHSWFQNFHWKCLSGDFIIAWWVPHKRGELRRQDM